MTVELLKTVLWIPFLLPALIYSIIFCIRGYKKGLYRALISVGATVIACIISILTARLISAPLAETAYGAVPPMDTSEYGIFAEIIPVFIKGIMQNVIALVLFSVLLFILSIILKAIASNIKKDSLQPKNNGYRWAGLVVRFVDALVLCTLLCLPIYGTIAAYAPAAERLVSTASDSDESFREISEYVTALSEHTLVKVSDSAPVSAVYKGLSDIKANEVDVNLPQMADAAEQVLTRIMSLGELPEAEREKAVKELIVYLRDEVVTENWFFGVYTAAKNEAVKVIRSNTAELTENEKKIMDEIISSVDFDKEELTVLSVEALDLAEYVLSEGLIDRVDEDGMKALLNDGFLERFGKLLNCNEGAASIKRLMILISLGEFFDDMDTALKMIESHPVTLKKDPVLQKKEAGAFLILMSGSDKLAIVEGLVRNPDFGYDVMKQYVTAELLAESVLYFGEIGGSNPLADYLTSNPDIFNSIMEELRKYETLPFDSLRFEEYIENTLAEYLNSLGLNSFVVGTGGDSFSVTVGGQGYVSGDVYSFNGEDGLTYSVVIE